LDSAKWDDTATILGNTTFHRINSPQCGENKMARDTENPETRNKQ